MVCHRAHSEVGGDVEVVGQNENHLGLTRSSLRTLGRDDFEEPKEEFYVHVTPQF